MQAHQERYTFFFYIPAIGLGKLLQKFDFLQAALREIADELSPVHLLQVLDRATGDGGVLLHSAHVISELTVEGIALSPDILLLLCQIVPAFRASGVIMTAWPALCSSMHISASCFAENVLLQDPEETIAQLGFAPAHIKQVKHTFLTAYHALVALKLCNGGFACITKDFKRTKPKHHVLAQNIILSNPLFQIWHNLPDLYLAMLHHIIQDNLTS